MTPIIVTVIMVMMLIVIINKNSNKPDPAECQPEGVLLGLGPRTPKLAT